jgi:hypothetical protein
MECYTQLKAYTSEYEKERHRVQEAHSTTINNRSVESVTDPPYPASTPAISVTYRVTVQRILYPKHTIMDTHKTQDRNVEDIHKRKC